MPENFFLSREITKNVKFSESVATKKKNPMQKYPHLAIPTGGPVDRSGGICFSESNTCCRCLDFARHDTRRSLCGYEYENQTI